MRREPDPPFRLPRLPDRGGASPPGELAAAFGIAVVLACCILAATLGA